MRTAVAFAPGAEARARLSRLLRGSAHVTFCDESTALVRVAASLAPSVVVVQVDDSCEMATAHRVAALRAGLPGTPVVAYVALDRSVARGLFLAARAGAADLLVGGVDDAVTAGAVLSRVVEEAEVALWMRADLDELVPPHVRPVFDHCLRHASRPLAVSSIARALGVSRRTLSRRLAHAGMPSPHAVVAWWRLILAARRLGEGAASVERVAFGLDFPSASALRNMLGRYAGLRIADLRREGAAPLIAAFRGALRAGASMPLASRRRREALRGEAARGGPQCVLMSRRVSA